MGDLFLLLVRWTHAVAAVAWVGGGIFYWAVLRPATSAGLVPQQLTRIARVEFGRLVLLAMWTLLLTGGVLFFARLSEPSASVPYGGVLAVKVALSAWMFFLTVGRGKGAKVEEEARGRLRRMVDGLGHINMTVILGIMIFLLSDVLRLIVERELEG